MYLSFNWGACDPAHDADRFLAACFFPIPDSFPIIPTAYKEETKIPNAGAFGIFGDPPGIRTPDPLLKRQSPDSQGWGEPKTCCSSSTFRSSVFCVYVTRPTAYPVFYYNQKNGIRQTFLSINRYLILEINYSKAIFNRDDKMFRKTLLPDTNIFLTTAEVPLCGTQGRRHPALFYEAFASFFLCPSQITSHPNTTDPQKSII